MVNFEQIQRLEHLPAKIAATVAQEIASGRLKAGDKLPTENELAKTFGVSRSVVREAIAQLRNEGLLDTRQGVGAFVLERRPMIRIDSTQLANPESFRSLFQLRIPLEIEAAGLAALHHTDEDLKRLDETLDLMRGMDTRWTAEGVAADWEFHCALADSTGNAYYAMFVGFIGDKITHSITTARARAELEQIVQITIAEHMAIRDAVATRDMMQARAAMRAHIMGAAARLDLQLDSPTGDRVRDDFFST